MVARTTDRDPSVVVVTAETELASSREDVWPLVTDTDRTNRLLLGAPAHYEPIAEGSRTAARYVGTTTNAGFRLAYEEAPFEWTHPQSFSVFRKMLSGPLKHYTYGIELAPSATGGTHLRVTLQLAPRHWLLKPIAWFEGRKFVRGVARLGHAMDAHLKEGAASPYLQPSSPADAGRLARAEAQLVERGVDAHVAKTLVELLRDGPDADLVRMRPLEIASIHELDGRETLRALLYGVTCGIAELRWALVCPSCRTASQEVASLADVADAGHCQLCDITFGIDLDRAVEATFRPHPSVREVPDQMFCVGGPWRTPHVLTQANLEDGARRALAAPAERGRYRVFARGGAIASFDVAEAGASSVEVRLADGELLPASFSVAPGGNIEVTNAGGEPLHVKIERLAYASLAATAHMVTTMPEFRRLFSRDILKASTPLKVSTSALLFTDLTGSTALYSKAGDAAAFRLVDDHFDLLRAIVARHGGTVVKTMGDAVMAAFQDAVDGARAAIDCLRDFETFRLAHEHGAETGLKLGMFSGPCYVVTANDAIDYFGQTVNCAARVQHLADSGELILQADVHAALPEADRAALVVVERFETQVKGVDEPLRLIRARVVDT